jgi:hypothetical protein
MRESVIIAASLGETAQGGLRHPYRIELRRGFLRSSVKGNIFTTAQFPG